jgi:hypothetical protein
VNVSANSLSDKNYKNVEKFANNLCCGVKIFSGFSDMDELSHVRTKREGFRCQPSRLQLLRPV